MTRKTRFRTALRARQRGFLLNPFRFGSTALPLDGITTAAAWSVARLLYTSYTGNPLIYVRRSSDNAGMNIGADASGNLDTATLLSFVGAGSGYVWVVYDQSGSGRHLLNATASQQPRIVNAGTLETQGGRPCCVFDGTDDFLFNNITDAVNDTAGFCWLNVTSVFLGRSPTSASWSIHLQYGGNSIVVGGVAYTHAAYTGSTFAQFTAQTTANNTSFVSRKNGAAHDSSSPSSGSLRAPGSTFYQTIGSALGNAAFFAGAFAESIIASGAMSTAERDAIEASQVAYWGL